MKFKRYISPGDLENLEARDINIAELIEYSTRKKDEGSGYGEEYTKYIPIEILIPDNYIE